MNPSIALNPGFNDIGGYVLAYVNNKAYAKGDKELNVYWAGARYKVTEQFVVAVAYYGEKQFAYATGINAGCSSVVSGACSGNLNVASVSLDYHFTKRFDSYAGAMWSNVSHGLENGYLNSNMIDPTVGVRFSFWSFRARIRGLRAFAGPETSPCRSSGRSPLASERQYPYTLVQCLAENG